MVPKISGSPGTAKTTAELAEYLAAVVESSDDAIISKNLHGIIQTWNAGAERIFGYTAAETIGQHISMLAPDDRKDEIPGIIEKISRGERVDHYHTKRKTRDGRIIDVSLTISPVRDPAGKIVGASKIARDITDRLRYEQISRDSTQQRLLLERVFMAQEDERRRLSRELHDEAGQLLTALLVGLKRLEESRSLNASRALSRDLRKLTTKALDDLRRLAHGLHPAALTDHGLHAAISAYVAEYSRAHHIRVRLTQDGLDLLQLPNALQIAIYRIIQEALTNVVRHAHAKSVDIRIIHFQETLQVSVTDDGHGFDTTELNISSGNHLGLRSISERSALFGGAATFRSGTEGTEILIKIPLSGDQLKKRERSGPLETPANDYSSAHESERGSASHTGTIHRKRAETGGRYRATGSPAVEH